MSKRLQVVVSDTDLASYERSARAVGLTLSEWVRQCLGKAQRDVSLGDVDRKLAVLRSAAGHSAPAPDIEVMLEEIERGYLADIEG